MRRLLAAGLVALALAASGATAKPVQQVYRIALSIPLPDGRWDLLSVDAAHRRVAIARGDSVTLVDLATDLPGPSEAWPAAIRRSPSKAPT